MAAKTRASEAAPLAADAPKIIAYKGFDKNLSCQGFKYKVGRTYTMSGHIKACERGFHACEAPLDVWSYYGPAASRFAIVEQGGDIARHAEDTKIASATITIQAELTLPDFIKRAVSWVLDHAKGNTATGYSGHAAATGYSGHAAATGYRGHAAATGDGGHAAATGDSGHAAATGYSGHAAVAGENAIAAALGPYGTAKAEIGGAIMLAAYDDKYNLVAVFSSLVGQNGIEAGKQYRLRPDGVPEIVESARQ